MGSPLVNTLCVENESAISWSQESHETKYVLGSEKSLSLGSQRCEAGQKSMAAGRMPELLLSPVLSSEKVEAPQEWKCLRTSKGEEQIPEKMYTLGPAHGSAERWNTTRNDFGGLTPELQVQEVEDGAQPYSSLS